MTPSIKPTETLYPHDLPLESVALTSGTLINKFRQEKVVSKDYHIGQNLLKSTTDGFVFLKQLLMIAHPKFTDTASGLDQIPVYSSFKDLYTFARAIQDYISVQRIEGRTYDMKQISQLFLKYLDEPLYQQAKLLMQTRIESYGAATLPISLQVPGLATTISQQTLQLNDTKMHEGTQYDVITKLSSITQDTFSTEDTDSFENVSFDQISAAISSSKIKYNGTCAACGKTNHHASECHFLMKMKQCLAYMKSDKNAGSRKAKYYKSKGEYNFRRDKVRMLQENNFIPPVLDPDIFLDIPETADNSENVHVQDSLQDTTQDGSM